jgi:geranylgeranyl diphosphate synthase type II
MTPSITPLLPFDFDAYCAMRRQTVDTALSAHLPPEDESPEILHKAMRYSVLAGGKRLRPLLCLAACEACGAPTNTALLPALAVEILHTYTLIHDDLPCMDDDDLRRGRPTSHKVFGEANALLAGDALLTLTFEWLARSQPQPPRTPADLVRTLAEAAGHRGVIAGQIEDLAAEGAAPSAARVESIHRLKTAALLRASVLLGGLSAGADDDHLAALARYGEAAGLAFQIADDLLNETSTPEQLGKATGSDRERSKMTYVRVFGLEVAQRRAETLTAEACSALAAFPGPVEPLQAFARYAIARKN